MSSTLSVTIHDRLQDVPQDAWDTLLGRRSVTLSRDFWRVVESSGLNDFTYRYLVFRDAAGQPIAATVAYSITTDIAIFAPRALSRALSLVRKVWPRFLKWNMLECGTPITINTPPYLLAPGMDDKALVPVLASSLRGLARRLRASIIVVRDFEPEGFRLEALFRADGYHWVDSLPNTYLDVRWTSTTQYHAAMRSYYRSKLHKHLQRNVQAGVRYERIAQFEHLAETLRAQWLVVHEHASEYQREVLTAEFYRRMSRDLQGQAEVLLFYRDDRLEAHALLLRDRDMLRWLYVGRNLAVNDSLYIFVAHAVVETAIAMGASRVEMGLTTYPIKQDLGAEVVPIKLAVRATSALINPFVGLGYALLNSVPRPSPRSVFKSATAAPRQPARPGPRGGEKTKGGPHNRDTA